MSVSSSQQAAVSPLDLLIHIESARDLPIKEADSPENAPGAENCHMRLIVEIPAQADQSEAAEGENGATENEERRQEFCSVTLTKANISHVALKAHAQDILISSLFESDTVNRILHCKYPLIRLQLVAGEAPQKQDEPHTESQLLAESPLDFSPLLHQKSFQKTMKLKNLAHDAPADKKSKKGSKNAPAADAPQLPEYSSITYSISLKGKSESILPESLRKASNFVSFKVGPIHNLPQKWLEPFAQQDADIHQLIKNHLFTYNVDIHIPQLHQDRSTLQTIPYTLKDGRLFQEKGQSDDASNNESNNDSQNPDESNSQPTPLIIAFPDPITIYLDPNTAHHMLNMVFNKESLKCTFYRSLNSAVVTDSSWEDFNKEKYQGEFYIPVTEFLEPGKTDHQYSDLPITPVTPEAEPADEQDTKKKGKDKGVKIPKGLPQELQPEEPLKEGEEHPYLASHTCTDVHLSFEYPAIPLAQDRLKSTVKLSELIPKRNPIFRKISSTQAFKNQVSNIIERLVTQYKESSRHGRGDSESNVRERFIFDLNNNGVFFSIKDSLKKAVVAIVKENFASENNKDPQQLQQFYNQVYVYLVEHIYEVLNSLYNGEPLAQQHNSSEDNDEEDRQNELTPDQRERLSKLQRLAQESEFEENYELASKYHQQRLDLSPNDEGLWYEFAIFNLRIHDEGKAEYCFRQCLGLNLTHKKSLFDYSILLMHQQKFKESQVLLNSLLDVDEQNTNAWVLLSLLYEQMDLDESATDALKHAKRLILRSGANDAASQSPSDLDLYLQVTEYILFTLHLDTVAEQLLLKMRVGEHSNAGSEYRSPTGALINPNQIYVLYGKMFMIRQDYERAEEQLKQALEKQYKYPEAWKLLGDVHYEQNRSHEAKQAYETSISVQSQDVSEWSLCLRLGRLYLGLSEYESARNMFIRSTQLWSSSLSWLGLGVAYYGCNEIQQAEQALNEANILNNENVEVWGWLCIVNVQQGQMKNATRCRVQMSRLSSQAEGGSSVGDSSGGMLSRIVSEACGSKGESSLSNEEFVRGVARVLAK